MAEQNLSALANESMKEKLRRRVASPSTLDQNQPTVGGIKSITNEMKKIAMKNFFERRTMLKIPAEIKDNHPDKEFAFITMKELQENSGFHPRGWKPFKYRDAKDVKEMNQNGFGEALDPYFHRNEMILAYMPKEEYDAMKMDEMIANDQIDLEAMITKNPNLIDCAPVASVTTETYELNKDFDINKMIKKDIKKES